MKNTRASEEIQCEKPPAKRAFFDSTRLFAAKVTNLASRTKDQLIRPAVQKKVLASGLVWQLNPPPKKRQQVELSDYVHDVSNTFNNKQPAIHIFGSVLTGVIYLYDIPPNRWMDFVQIWEKNLCGEDDHHSRTFDQGSWGVLPPSPLTPLRQPLL